MSESRPKRKAPRSAYKPGQSGNPGGIPAGKRISTWMLELGAMSVAELTKIKPTLPVNGLIALARIKSSLGLGGERSTEIILDRTEGKVVQPIEGEIKETKRIVLIFPEAAQ